MADAATIEELRDLINEPDNEAPWTDEYLGGRIDGWEGTLEGLASRLWTKKAATYAEMIDMKEGNSDRKLSQLHTQALTMARNFMVDESGEVVTSGRRASRTRPIERM
jgi:hypothetical protein